MNYNELRLVKYSRLIDQTIAEGRYTLATQLAYRCLLEYNRLFIRFCIPNLKWNRMNAFQLTVEIVRFARSNSKTFKLPKSRELMKMLRASYYLTSLSNKKLDDKDLRIDRVTARFAGDQSLAISRVLMGTVNSRLKE